MTLGNPLGRFGLFTERSSRVAWKQSPYYGLQFKGDKEKTAETLMAVAVYGTV